MGKNRFGSSLRLCTANMECGLLFWQGIATVLIVRSSCTYQTLSSHSLTHLYRFDNNQKLDGTSFKDRNKQWPKDPLVEDFSSWIDESFGLNAAQF
jgi:hypothetical protein